MNGVSAPHRIRIVLSTLLYVAVFNVTYLSVIAGTYDFWGLTKNQTPWPYLAVSWIVSVLPSFWLPASLERPSQLLFLIQYYVIFIPASFILYNTSRPVLAPAQAFTAVLLMFAGLSTIQLSYRLPLLRFRHLRVPASIFWTAFVAGMVGLFGYTLVKFGGNFRFADLEGIYAVRAGLAEAVEASGTRFGFYAQMWLAGFFLPFGIALGISARRRILALLCLAGYLLLFGIGGSKTTLFTIVYFPAVWLWLRVSRRHAMPAFAIGLSGLLAVGAALRGLGYATIALWYIAVVNFRTFSIPAQLIALYLDFFSNHPVTHLSHIRGISSIISYPYETDVPRMLGLYYYSDADLGLNAGVWAGDGIAGFGPAGIVLASAACAAVFWVFDCVASRYKVTFVIVAITFIAVSFGNISLSTTIVSGGLGLLGVALLICPRAGIGAAAFRGT